MLRNVKILAVAAAFFCWSDNAAFAVRYNVQFEAAWSNRTHPGAYPSGAHFSPLWVATHNENVKFWESGGIASDGIQQMAELGGTSILTGRFGNARNAGDAVDLRLGGGILSPGGVEVAVEVAAATHSLISVVTMVAPSPDWFVGVNSLDLWDTDHWIESLTVDLYAYDAGTDSGTSFRSSNSDTNPREPIALLGAPLTNTPALGTLTITFVEPLAGDANADFMRNVDDLNIVRNMFGNTGAADGSLLGDTYPFDGLVDIGDLNAVRNNFGTRRTAVPEPSGLALATLLALVAIAVPRYRRG